MRESFDRIRVPLHQKREISELEQKCAKFMDCANPYYPPMSHVTVSAVCGESLRGRVWIIRSYHSRDARQAGRMAGIEPETPALGAAEPAAQQGPEHECQSWAK